MASKFHNHSNATDSEKLEILSRLNNNNCCEIVSEMRTKCVYALCRLYTAKDVECSREEDFKGAFFINPWSDSGCNVQSKKYNLFTRHFYDEEISL